MYKIMLELHSGLRYVVFLMLVVAVIVAYKGLVFKSEYSEGTRKWNLFTMISAHVQLLAGIVLYFLSPLVQFSSAGMKDQVIRYWTSEHVVMMLFALALVTIGHSRSKKANTTTAKHRSIFIFYLLGLVVIITALILMPFRSFFGMSH